MVRKTSIAFILCISFSLHGVAQGVKKDSAEVVKTFLELCSISKTVDIYDPETISRGRFYKAAPFIIYRGDDKKRNWKDFTDYNNTAEKKRVDGICERFNRTVNLDSGYTISKYFTETESEGTWHVLMVAFNVNSTEKTAAFAFLKIGDRFGLGDID